HARAPPPAFAPARNPDSRRQPRSHPTNPRLPPPQHRPRRDPPCLCLGSNTSGNTFPDHIMSAMDRRQFLSTSTASLAAALAAEKPKRVGLIGCGWYGKCDLFRLIQVSPVEVVSLCDVDKKMLAQAADLVSTRQASHKTPRTYSDYREMLKERD